MSTASATATLDPIAHARRAGLRYVNPQTPGIRRLRAGKTVRYLGVNGRALTDPAALTRIRSLVLPPAWRDVWICPDPDGHLQAIGLDARGRKQYRYHPRWRETRDATKFGKLVAFARVLPIIRRRVQADLRLPGLPLPKVIAAIVALLDRTGIRVGNEEYKEENGSYGLTTIQDRHAKIRGATLCLDFNGKSGVRKALCLQDPTLARIVKRCQDLPGQDLFQYLDEAGKVHDVNSTHVNDYLHAIAGEAFTAKDFRTWAGTLCAAEALGAAAPCDSEREMKRNIVAAIKAAAAELGNRPATCRKYYVHPAILEHYLCGELLRAIDGRSALHRRRSATGLDAFEKVVLHLLERRAKSHPPAA